MNTEILKMAVSLKLPELLNRPIVNHRTKCTVLLFVIRHLCLFTHNSLLNSPFAHDSISIHKLQSQDYSLQFIFECCFTFLLSERYYGEYKRVKLKAKYFQSEGERAKDTQLV